MKKGTNYWLYCFDKPECRSFPVSIEDIACEKFFYERKDDEQVLEKALSKLEKDFSEVYFKLITSRSLLSLKWREKNTLASFVAVQDLRTREFREILRSTGKEMKRVLGTKNPSKELADQLKTVDSEETIHEIQSKFIMETLSGKTGFAEIVLNMKWILFENNTNIPLWTSDHPVNRYNPIDQSPLGNLGLKSKGIQVFFPLNPTMGIVFGDLTEYFSSPEKVTCIKPHVTFCNTLQVKSSTRHVFSANNNFYLAKKWLSENLELKDPDRLRMEARN